MEKVSVKNMVCIRCVMVVTQQVAPLNVGLERVTLGELVFKNKITAAQKEQVSNTLKSLGFEVIDDEKMRMVERIKHIIISLVHHRDEGMNNNLSEILSADLHCVYNYLSGIFSEVTGKTIEKYYIAQKIERAKELLDYDELTLSEIAHRLNYSSVSYLSNQFKKVAGLAPSVYKQQKSERRTSIDKL
ncbi:helix-turn-helix transcriptional regulator [Chitinophaga oryzae]|uniref:Helix-turn-helix transcriptional regulator n=1 Tax=Chitinophaga oryzae TaxID=2725414 RepID=A0AAE6ZJ53_9BACT|nr:AraC family transcriptional regulator [Chitinophaga oryzae]QJB32877.1 helix-turn-helix transcriptional regulator [Chitinophaga oryzae]QJB39340.1 helix-turn-helix transcriptional regulator [Chitinophaga oryzae]